MTWVDDNENGRSASIPVGSRKESRIGKGDRMSRLSVCILVLIGSLTISTSLAAAGGETPVGLQGTIVFKPTDWRMGKVTW